VSSAPAREFDLELDSNETLANLCGPLDGNLQLLEERLGVQIRRRGSHFTLRGERSALAEAVLRDLAQQAEARAVTGESVHLGLVEHGASHSADVRGAPAATAAAAPGARGATGARAAGAAVAREAPPADVVVIRTPALAIRARGEHQRGYLASIHGHDLTFGVGPAGTGKTYLAVACAVELLLAERVRRLVLVRPAVEAGERLGFLPGDMSQKVDPYLRPIYDALYEMLGFDRVARLIERAVIEVAPLAFMRGRSLNDAFVILDEAQNTTPEQMKMFLTRIGFGSRAVITGDVTQTDLPAGKLSGLRHALQVLRNVKGVAFTFFDAEDVVRHPLVQRIVQAYEAEGQG
jgi:phosphate starvation-inducible PhoH-like protein